MTKLIAIAFIASAGLAVASSAQAMPIAPLQPHRSWYRQRSNPKVCNGRFLKLRRWRVPLSCRILGRVPTWFLPHLLSPKAGLRGYAFRPVMMQPWLLPCCGCFRCRNRTARRSDVVGASGCLAISMPMSLPNRRCGFIMRLPRQPRHPARPNKVSGQNQSNLNSLTAN